MLIPSSLHHNTNLVQPKRKQLTSFSCQAGLLTRASFSLVRVLNLPRRVDSASEKSPAMRISLYDMPASLDATRKRSLDSWRRWDLFESREMTGSGSDEVLVTGYFLTETFALIASGSTTGSDAHDLCSSSDSFGRITADLDLDVSDLESGSDTAVASFDEVFFGVTAA